MPDHFDLIVLGSGSSGTTVAKKAARHGMTVACVENREVGGTCALRGCNPKKVLTRSAELMNFVSVMDGRYLRKNDAALDWSAVREYQRTYTRGVPKSETEGMEDAGVHVLKGDPQFTGPHDLTLEGRALTADKFVIATGSKPSDVPFEGSDLLTTSDEFLFLDELPRSIVFLGGGYISAEFATIAEEYGCEVTILERADRILEGFDPDLVDGLTDHMRSIGYRVLCDADVKKVERSGDGLTVTFERGGETDTATAAMVVHGLGRSPSIETLGLDAAGVKAGKKGIEVDDHCRTSASHVWAIGDCANGGRPMLTPVANDEARAVANQLRGKDNTAVDEGPVPFSAYTIPQIASVGLSEEAARETYRDGLTVKCESMDSWTTYRKVGAEAAHYKTLLAPDGTLVGAHLMAPHASETINALAMLVRFKITRPQIKQMLFAYPTLSSEIKAMV